MERLCVDCRHFVPDADFQDPGDRGYSVRYAKCGLTVDPVSGLPLRFCSSERVYDSFLAWLEGSCGRNGRFFAAADKKVAP